MAHEQPEEERAVEEVESNFDIHIAPHFAVEFYRKAFGAKELFRLSEPGGKIGHAELEIGRCRMMLADESPDFGALSPVTVGGSPVALHLYVEDVDAIVARATAAGATLLRPVQDDR